MFDQQKDFINCFTIKTLTIAIILVLITSFGTLGAYGAGNGNNQNTPITTTDPDVVVVSIDSDYACVEVVSQVVQGTGVLIPINQDFVFTVIANEGYDIEDVLVDGNSVGDFEGTYTIPAEDVDHSLNIVVKTSRTGNKTPVVVKVSDTTVEYDGQQHSCFLEVFDASGNKMDDVYACSQSLPIFVNVSDSSQVVICADARIFDYDNNDITNDFDITFKSGLMTITPAKIRISTESSEKVYDGYPLTNGDISVELPGIEELFAILPSLTVTGSQTEVGESTNGYSLDWGDVDSNNYYVEENLGTLKVTRNEAAIVISVPNVSKVYDGKPLTVDSVDVAAPDGFRVQATTKGEQTDVGTSTVVIDEYRIFDKDNNDITDTFSDIQLQSGSATVTPAFLSVTTPSATKTYDGEPLVATDAENWIVGFVDGESASAKITGSQTDIGVSNNTYEIIWNKNAKKDNYQIVEQLGTLEVLRTDNAFVLSDNIGNDSNSTEDAGNVIKNNGSGIEDKATENNTYVSEVNTSPYTGRIVAGVNYKTPSDDNTKIEEKQNTLVDSVAEQMENIHSNLIREEITPISAQQPSQIEDDETPLGAFDESNVWVRWYVVVGIISTLLYGIGVICRRVVFTRKLCDQENSFLELSNDIRKGTQVRKTAISAD